MVRLGRAETALDRRFPRARRDGDYFRLHDSVDFPFSPRAWGWSALHQLTKLFRSVIPARVGMVRCTALLSMGIMSFPRARGDGPITSKRNKFFAALSPRAWGWSVNIAERSSFVSVIPSRVGMVRTIRTPTGTELSFPRARGDGP